MWIPPEIKDPVLTHAPARKSMACFGAVSLETGKFAFSLCETFDAKTFEHSSSCCCAVAPEAGAW